MANTKSVKKRALVNETKATRSKATRSKVKTAAKKVDVAIVAGNKAAAQAQLISAITGIDRTITKGAYHKNTAFRKVSRLTKTANAMA